MQQLILESMSSSEDEHTNAHNRAKLNNKERIILVPVGKGHQVSDHNKQMLEDQEIFQHMINTIKGEPKPIQEQVEKEDPDSEIMFDASELIDTEETKVYKIEKIEQELANEQLIVETPEHLRKHMSWQTGIHKDATKLSKGQKKKQKKLPAVESESIQRSFNMDPFRVIPSAENW